MPHPPLHLVCPRCRRLDEARAALLTHPLLRPDGEEVDLHASLEELSHLGCANPHCRATYPVIDGAPVIFAQPAALPAGDALDPFALSPHALCALLDGRTPGDPLCALFARLARHLFSADDDSDEGTPHAIDVARRLSPHLPDDPEVLSLGAGVGREASACPGRLTLFDAHLPSVRLSIRLLRDGQITLPVPTSALTWRPRTLTLTEPPRASTAHLCANALDPPFHAERFDAVLALNLIDSVPEPYILLGQAHALLRAGGHLALSSPFTWREAITAPERWLEAMSPRADATPEAVLEQLVAELEPPLEVLERFDSRWHHLSRPRERVIYESATWIWRKPA